MKLGSTGAPNYPPLSFISPLYWEIICGKTTLVSGHVDSRYSIFTALVCYGQGK